MIMTAEEIVREYRAAKKPMKQIGILADENQCGKQDIVKILLEAGETVPPQFLNRGPKAAETTLKGDGWQEYDPDSGELVPTGKGPEELPSILPAPPLAGDWPKEQALTVEALLNSMGGEVNPKEPIPLIFRAEGDSETVRMTEASRLLRVFFPLAVVRWRPTTGGALAIEVRSEEPPAAAIGKTEGY